VQHVHAAANCEFGLPGIVLFRRCPHTLLSSSVQLPSWRGLAVRAGALLFEPKPCTLYMMITEDTT
jgi:hypothetical protein